VRLIYGDKAIFALPYLYKEKFNLSLLQACQRLQ